MPLRRDNGLDDFVEKLKELGSEAVWYPSPNDVNTYFIDIVDEDYMEATMVVIYHDTYYNVEYHDYREDGAESSADLEYMLHDCLVY
jgi:hypothetical protein